MFRSRQPIVGTVLIFELWKMEIWVSVYQTMSRQDVITEVVPLSGMSLPLTNLHLKLRSIENVSFPLTEKLITLVLYQVLLLRQLLCFYRRSSFGKITLRRKPTCKTKRKKCNGRWVERQVRSLSRPHSHALVYVSTLNIPTLNIPFFNIPPLKYPHPQYPHR